MVSFRKNYVMLLSELDLDLILPVMFSERMIGWSEYQSLVAQKNESSEKQRRDTVLSDLPRKGQSSIQKFCECLVWSGQIHLAERMEFNVSSVKDPNKHHAYDTKRIHENSQPTQPPSINSAVHFQHVQPSPNPVQPVQPFQPYPPNHPPLPDNKVLILYCKDGMLHSCPELRTTEQRTTLDYCKEVSDLVETLTLFSNNLFTCIYDKTSSDGTFIQNFIQWADIHMNQCNTILLLCSPQLDLQCTTERIIDMERGQFSRDSFINVLHTPNKCVIPVFLNMSKQVRWIPSSLKSAACYEVNVKALQEGCVGVKDERELVARATHCFESDERLIDLVELLKVLRKETSIVVSSPHVDLPEPKLEPKLEGIVRKIYLIWQELGTRLGIQFHDIQQIQQTCPTDNVEAARKMLEAWKRKKDKVDPKQSLINALIKCKYPAVAEEVERNFEDKDFY